MFFPLSTGVGGGGDSGGLRKDGGCGAARGSESSPWMFLRPSLRSFIQANSSPLGVWIVNVGRSGGSSFRASMPWESFRKPARRPSLSLQGSGSPNPGRWSGWWAAAVPARKLPLRREAPSGSGGSTSTRLKSRPGVAPPPRCCKAHVLELLGDPPQLGVIDLGTCIGLGKILFSSGRSRLRKHLGLQERHGLATPRDGQPDE